MTALQSQREGEVAILTLSRPDKRNALSIALRHELADALEELGKNPEVAVVVITGQGSAFCAGMDKSEFGGDRAHKQALVESTERFFRALFELPRPSIAAVNGPALGGGFVLAALCDLRVAHESARFGCPEISFGIPPAFAALRRVLPDPVAREVAFNGRLLDATEARALHMVAEVSRDPVLRGLELAKHMARYGVRTLEMTKRLAIAGEDTAVKAGFDAELRMFRSALLGE